MKLKHIALILLSINAFIIFCGFSTPEPNNVTILSFDTLIAFPDKVFSAENKHYTSFDENKITCNEFNRILDELYKNNYILVSIYDIIDKSTSKRIKPNIPEDKKPLIFTFNNVTYSSNYQNQGEIDKIIIDRNNQLATYTTKKSIQDRVQYANEFIVILEDFIKEHPDFSYKNSRGIIFLSGENGILGYNTSHKNASSKYERKRVSEIIYKLKSLGWQFGSHNYTYKEENSKTDIEFAKDITFWDNEVKNLIGNTELYAPPYGINIESSTKKDLLISKGFKIFFTNSSESKIEQSQDLYNISRIHISGKSLRENSDTLSALFDCNKVYDHNIRLIPYQN